MLIDYYIDLEVIYQKYKIYYEIAILRVCYLYYKQELKALLDPELSIITRFLELFG